jgi:predicted deacetylase
VTGGAWYPHVVPVHVSLHDVSPVWAPEIELALELAHAVGAKPALLVVPDFHGSAPLAAHPAFCSHLRDLQAEGHEVYLHGFSHAARDRPAKGAGALGWFIAQRVVSHGEAEFRDVTPDEAVRRLTLGERALADAGLTVDGFVAPAWSMPPWLMPILAERGYRFTEDHTRVYDPRAGTSRPSVVLNFASRTPPRLLASVAYCRVARPLAAIFPARLAIHPADMRFALLRRETQRLLAWASDDLVDEGAGLFRP